MASTFFQDYNQNTPIVATWLNDVNSAVYGPGGASKKALGVADAWVRFSVSGAVVTIQQSLNVQSVSRLSAGIYQITYGTALTNITNCYQISSSIPGFVSYSAETANSVTINIANTSDSPTDPGSCCVVIYGAN